MQTHTCLALLTTVLIVAERGRTVLTKVYWPIRTVAPYAASAGKPYEHCTIRCHRSGARFDAMGRWPFIQPGGRMGSCSITGASRGRWLAAYANSCVSALFASRCIALRCYYRRFCSYARFLLTSFHGMLRWIQLAQSTRKADRVHSIG